MPQDTILVLSTTHNGLKDDFNFSTAMNLLPLQTQANILRKKFQVDQIRALCNQLLQLYGILLWVPDINREAIQLTRGKFGKPRLLNFADISFSMSNGEDNVVMYMMQAKGNDSKDAMCGEVGVDIASTVDLIKIDDLQLYKDTVFNAVEFDHLNKFTNDLSQLKKMFAHYWSLKESYTKLIGLGLNTNLLDINLGILEQTDYSIKRNIRGKDIIFHTCWINDNEVISICHAQTNLLERPPILTTVNFSDVIQRLSITI